MQNLVVFILLASCSLWALADHHQEDHQDNRRPAKGLFEHADLDNDGSISAEEHEAALAKMNENRRKRFADMDADGDGVVSKEEAKAGKDKCRAEMKEKRDDRKKEAKRGN